MSNLINPIVVTFGPYEFNPHSGELRKEGMRVRLEGQPLSILRVLLDRPGELVTREELRKKLWPGDTFVDFEHSLNAAVKRLRAALNDSADQPRYIETLARRGYRFIAPVSTTGAETGVVAPSVTQGLPFTRVPSAARSRGLWLIAVAVCGIAVLAWGWRLWRHRTAASAAPAIRSIAVLPLKNLSGDSAQDYLADGMTEELIGRLSGIHDLRVSSRTSVTRFKDTQLSVREIAKILGVDAIIEGSVIREGNRIRVHAQLIRAATDDHFWSKAYDRQIRDVLTLESEVAQAIADQVRIELTPEQQAHLRSAREVNPEAYDAYLRGRFLLQTPTLQANNSAKRYFQEAIQKDSTFALAYAGLADCYLDSGAYRWVRPQDAYRLGKEAIQKATRLDDTLSELHSSMGYLQWQYDWDWQAAEKEIRYALELNPNNMDARDGLIWFLAWSGRGTEALEELGKLRVSDPAYPLAGLDESGVYYHARDYRGLMEASQKALSADPNNWTGHYFLAVSYDGLNRHADAIPKYQKGVELSPDQTDAIAGLAHAYALAGERAETAKILRQLQERSKASYVSPYMLATIFTALGDKDQAFTFLEEAYQQRSPDIAYFLRADLRLDPLRGDPRFADLLRRVGLD